MITKAFLFELENSTALLKAIFVEKSILVSKTAIRAPHFYRIETTITSLRRQKE
jgi:hypothetical protein